MENYNGVNDYIRFRVGQDRPRDVALTHIDGRRNEILQARDQVRLMGRRGAT